MKGNDLWFVEVASGKATRLTADGSPTVLNGRLDWVYEEELAGRERRPGLRVGARLLRDRLPAPRPVARPGVPDRRLPPDEREAPAPALPEAGRPERHAVGPRRLLGRRRAADDLDGRSRSTGRTVLLGPELSWTPDSTAVAFTKMNRTQTEIEVLLLPRAKGSTLRGAS